jgi:hypothetical protein
MIKTNSACFLLYGPNMIGKTTFANNIKLPYLELDKYNRSNKWNYEKLYKDVEKIQNKLCIADFHFKTKAINILSLFFEIIIPIYILIKDEQYIQQIQKRKNRILTNEEIKKYLKNKKYKDNHAKKTNTFFISNINELNQIISKYKILHL